MAKRLSPKRRHKALNRKLVIARAKEHDDSAKLQQGPVRCALARNAANLKGLSVPRGIDLDSQGRKLRKSGGGGTLRIKPFDQARVEDRIGVSDAASRNAPKSD